MIVRSRRSDATGVSRANSSRICRSIPLPSRVNLLVAVDDRERQVGLVQSIQRASEQAPRDPVHREELGFDLAEPIVEMPPELCHQRRARILGGKGSSICCW